MREHFNSAASASHEAMATALQCLKVVPVDTPDTRAERALVRAVQLMEAMGGRLVPLQVRLSSPRLRVIDHLLNANPRAYMCYRVPDGGAMDDEDTPNVIMPPEPPDRSTLAAAAAAAAGTEPAPLCSPAELATTMCGDEYRLILNPPQRINTDDGADRSQIGALLEDGAEMLAESLSRVARRIFATPSAATPQKPRAATSTPRASPPPDSQDARFVPTGDHSHERHLLDATAVRKQVLTEYAAWADSVTEQVSLKRPQMVTLQRSFSAEEAATRWAAAAAGAEPVGEAVMELAKLLGLDAPEEVMAPCVHLYTACSCGKHPHLTPSPQPTPCCSLSLSPSSIAWPALPCQWATMTLRCESWMTFGSKQHALDGGLHCSITWTPKHGRVGGTTSSTAMATALMSWSLAPSGATCGALLQTWLPVMSLTTYWPSSGWWGSPLRSAQAIMWPSCCGCGKP